MKPIIWSLLLVVGVLNVSYGQNAETMESTLPGSEMMSDTPSMTPTMTPVKPTLPPTTTEGCYDSLDSVDAIMQDDLLVFTQKDIILCPNTTFEIGRLIPGIGIVDGQATIVPRSNTLIKCGEDGKLENGCILKNGDFAVMHIPSFYSTEVLASNVVFQGLTFQGQSAFSIFYAKAGDVTFIDCMIKDTQNNGPIMFAHDDQLGARRNLAKELLQDGLTPWEVAGLWMEHWMESQEMKQGDDRELRRLAAMPNEETQQQEERRLQDQPRLHSKLLGFHFVNTTQNQQQRGSNMGIVNIGPGSNDVVMEDCTFSDNKWGDGRLAPLGYAVILYKGNSLAMKNVCFRDNDFRGAAAVVVELTEYFTSENVYAPEGDDEVDCPFAAYFASDADVLDRIYECIEPDASVCPLDVVPTFSPTTPETAAPTPAPTTAPSDAPTMSTSGIALFTCRLSGALLTASLIICLW